jgi:hypothetical protein
VIWVVGEGAPEMTTTKKIAKIVRIKIEKGTSGLFFATSPDLKGLHVGKRSLAELETAIPEVIAALYAACDVHVLVSKAEDDDSHGDLSPWVAFPADVARAALDKTAN